MYNTYINYIYFNEILYVHKIVCDV